MNDVPVLEFARYLSYLDPLPPITKELDKWGVRYYPSQKIHMYDWISSQPKTGKGAYSRREGNTSSAVMYNRFLNPGGLLWMAEALGETEETLRKAVSAAVEAEKENYRKRCTAFRQVIPWSRIMELYENPHGWLYDKKMLPLIEFDPYPMIKQVRKYNKILDDEQQFSEEQLQAMGIIVSKPREKEKLSKAERKARGWEF